MALAHVVYRNLCTETPMLHELPAESHMLQRERMPAIMKQFVCCACVLSGSFRTKVRCTLVGLAFDHAHVTANMVKP